ncbi:MAG: WecB/TagA/CpsF family glycosyltransferase [Rhizobiaceae bacterium]|nr:WecB/TagA/CpsF family glycosyltransferase [Rhizobiaceae bacterium]
MNVHAAKIEAPGATHHFVLGMRLDHLPLDRFVDDFSTRAENRLSGYCCVPDAYQCVMSHDNPDHMQIVNAADFVISDSTILQKARSLRHGVPAMRTQLGSGLMRTLCREAERRALAVALIGGRDDEVLEDLKAALTRDFPSLQIAFAYSPPFRELDGEEEDEMIQQLTQSDAAIVFVGLGCPKQERWMARHHSKVSAMMIGVGAAFDTISGRVSSSPEFVHRVGLEWLFRLLREPRRLYRRYLVSAPRFIWLLSLDWAASKLKPNSA